MAKKMFLLKMVVMILTFGMVVVGCDTESSSSGSSNDPIQVNLNLPAIQEVAAFEGTFVSSETEAGPMVGDAMNAISGVMGGVTSSSSSVMYSLNATTPMSIGRSVQEQPFSEVYDHNTKLFPGGEVTGFVEGYQKMSAANDNNPGGSVGDYQEMSIRAKFQVDIKNVIQSNITLKGKYIFDENVYLKMQITSVSPSKGSIAVKMDVTDGYALSVSKGGKGLKFVMNLSSKGDKTFSDISANNVNLSSYLTQALDTYNLTIVIYDNNNDEKWRKTFTTYAEAAAYLGIK
ncbi:MAG: hypothetical protein LBJ41_07180 [Treponema sp.]|jgi:hypothetical protein|nr:hypothetical protein [Treponema sp.]